jgi:integrase
MSAVTSDTVTGWLEHWLTNIAAGAYDREPGRATRRWCGCASRPVSACTTRPAQPEHLEHFYSDLLDEGLSAATVLRAHRIISRAMKVATQRGRVHRNVAMLVGPPAQRRSEAATALDLDESRAVLPRTDAGPRRGRRCSGRSCAARSQQRPSAAARGRIAHAQGGPDGRADAGRIGLANDDDLVFAQANGRPIDKKSDYDDWCRLLERAGVRHVRLHDGPHTAATLLLSEGVHPRVVMELNRTGLSGDLLV